MQQPKTWIVRRGSFSTRINSIVYRRGIKSFFRENLANFLFDKARLLHERIFSHTTNLLTYLDYAHLYLSYIFETLHSQVIEEIIITNIRQNWSKYNTVANLDFSIINTKLITTFTYNWWENFYNTKIAFTTFTQILISSTLISTIYTKYSFIYEYSQQI